MKKTAIVFLILFCFTTAAFSADPNKNLVRGAFKNDLFKVISAIDNGADINTTKGSSAGNTALIISSRDGYTEIALFLLESGADPNKVNKKKRSALLYASKNGDEKLVKALLKKGADPNKGDYRNNKPLHFALWRNNYKIIKYFKKYGVNLNSLHILDRIRPLNYAIAKEHVESVRELVRLGTALYYEGEKSNPLLRTIGRGNAEIVKVLLDGGADPLKKDVWGRDAFNIASLKEQKEILIYLAERYRYSDKIIEKMKNSNFMYGSPKRRVIVWFYGYRARDEKPGILKGFQAPVVGQARSQIIHGIDTLSYNAKILKDRNKNLYFSYRTPFKIKPGKPFIGGFILDLTLYEYTIYPTNGYQPVSLKNRNFPDNVKPHLKDEPELLIHNPQIRMVSKKLRNRSGSYRDMIKAADLFVHNHLSYDMPPKRPNTAVDVLGFKVARCGEYTKLKSSLLRSAGIPTRKVYGTSPYDFGPVHLDKSNTINDHVWLDAYIPGHGWQSVPSTSKFFNPMQFRDIYKKNYYIRRKGYDTDYKHLRKTSRIKRFTNSHGNGVFLNISSMHFRMFAKVLKEILTYDKAPDPSIFQKIDRLPDEAKVIANWFLTSKENPYFHDIAARNFLEAIKKIPKFKLENFLYVSSPLMKKRIKNAGN